jgi:DNA-binding PadR family transcriptional regulator
MTRILVLWLLSEQALHGYRIKRILEDEAYAFWFSVEFASIYSVLRTLVKQAYVEETGLEQDGARPERMGYKITRSGRAHLRELLRKSWLTVPLTGDAFQLAIAGAAELGEKEVVKLKDERVALLVQRLKACKRLRRAALDEAMVERGNALMAAELRWLKEWNV